MNKKLGVVTLIAGVFASGCWKTDKNGSRVESAVNQNAAGYYDFPNNVGANFPILEERLKQEIQESAFPRRVYDLTAAYASTNPEFEAYLKRNHIQLERQTNPVTKTTVIRFVQLQDLYPTAN